MSEDVLPWLVPALVPEIHARSRRRLARLGLDSGGPARSTPIELARRSGLSRAQARLLTSAHAERMAAAELARADRLGARVVPLPDPRYPSRLRELDEPPLCLYVLGELPSATGPAVAIVGARRATRYGVEAARRLARDLARAGVCVVSGLAYGVDGAAHEGALAGGGVTLAVLGSGLDRPYPSAHRPLASRIARSGAVISELPLGSEPRPWSFPRRNRIIAGLVRAVVVVEAAVRSGSLITARCALDHGREVLAVPGPIGTEQSAGANLLLRDGARPVLDVDDVLAALPSWPEAPTPVAEPEPEPPIDPTQREVLALLTEAGTACSPDAIAARSAFDPSALAVALTELELSGRIRRESGGFVAE